MVMHHSGVESTLLKLREVCVTDTSTLEDLVPSSRVGKVTRHFKKCPNCLGLFKWPRRHKCPKKKRGQMSAQLMA